MTHYAVVDDFRVGMPQTALPGFAPRGIACHTTEGGEGEIGALGTIRFLIEAASRNASYHEVWYAKLDGFGARRIVPPGNAAHSMNPARPPWAPNDRVRRILGDRWYDPNAWSYAVSIAGTTAVTVPALVNNPGFMAGARRRIGELQAQFRASLVLDPMFNHGEGQEDRSDWGPLMRPAILAEPEADVPVLTRPVREKWLIPGNTTFWVGGPGFGEQKAFGPAPIELWSNGESVDGLWRRIEYHNEPNIGEELWVLRKAMTSKGGRNPANGYGPPAPTGDTSAARLEGFADAKTKASAAVGGITP